MAREAGAPGGGGRSLRHGRGAVVVIVLLLTAGACRAGGDGGARRDGAAATGRGGTPGAVAPAEGSESGTSDGAAADGTGTSAGTGGDRAGGASGDTEAGGDAGGAGGPAVDRDAPGRGTQPVRPPGWRTIAASPLRGRHAHSAVWTGSEMIVWGGASRAGNALQYLEDGGAYDPGADRWRTLARSPLNPRADHVAAWTGAEMLVWGGSPGPDPLGAGSDYADGALYDPAADRWRSMARFPLAARWGARAVWTGSHLVVWGGAPADAPDGPAPARLADGAAYDPAADRWAVLPPAPIPGRVASLAAATDDGDALFSWGYGDDNRAVAQSARYDVAESRWAVAAPAPETSSGWCADRAGCVGVDAGRRLVFAGEGLAYDEAADRWATLPANPYADPGLDGKATAWTGRRTVVWGGGTYAGEFDGPPATVAPGGAAYDPSVNRWEDVPPAPVPARARARAVWTGAEFVVWGGESTYTERRQYADGAAWTPAG